MQAVPPAEQVICIAAIEAGGGAGRRGACPGSLGGRSKKAVKKKAARLGRLSVVSVVQRVTG
jgi:hypothetical protein